MPKSQIAPNKTLIVDGVEYPIHSLDIPQNWHRAAKAKGYRIAARIHDRLHVALCCQHCGGLTKVRTNVLLSFQPTCQPCLTRKRQDLARRAGLVFSRVDRTGHQYAIWLAPCGHEVSRQYEFVERMAAGRTNLRCEICQLAKEDAEALSMGWKRIGTDPKGNPSYRLYAHSCGHLQRISRGNLQWGQCDCAACGTSWSARPSAIYLVRIQPPAPFPEVVKLGFSKHHVKRFRHQLALPDEAKVQTLRLLPIKNGHSAMSAEKSVHRHMVRHFPDLVVPPHVFAGFLNVTSEIYWPQAVPEINRQLDAIEAEHAA